MTMPSYIAMIPVHWWAQSKGTILPTTDPTWALQITLVSSKIVWTLLLIQLLSKDSADHQLLTIHTWEFRTLGLLGALQGFLCTTKSAQEEWKDSWLTRRYLTRGSFKEHCHAPLGLLPVLSTHTTLQAWKLMLIKMADVCRQLVASVIWDMKDTKMASSVLVSQFFVVVVLCFFFYYTCSE